MNPLLEALLGTLGYVGSSLDKPGATVRGLLGGQGASALANLIPFSDTMGVTDPEQRMSGRGLLEHYGALDQKESDDGFGFGDVLGMGVEAATDPLQWGGIAKLGSMMKGNRVARASNELGIRNTMHNLDAQELVSKGAMPPEVAALTKVRDEAGPVATYHGTPHAFERYDMAKMDPEGLYGPGIYTTVNPEIASEYASKGAADKFTPRGDAASALQREVAEFETAAEQARKQRWDMPLQTSFEGGQVSPREELYNREQEAMNQVFRRKQLLQAVETGDHAAISDYLEENPQWQSLFDHEPAPRNVRKQFLDVRNPFDANAHYGHSEVVDLLNRMGLVDDGKALLGKAVHDNLGGKWISEGRPYLGGTGDELYRALEAMFGRHEYDLSRIGFEPHTHPSVGVNALLQRAGHDAIVHQGGSLAGGGRRLHDVTIAFSPDQVYQPIVAPALKSVPPHMDERSLSPLLAALAGENALTRTYPQGA